MNDATDEELNVLHALRVRGLATPDLLVESAGLPREDIQRILDEAVERGLARSRTGGRVEGYMLTGDGREHHAALLARAMTSEQRAALSPAYEAFLVPNQTFKELTTEWQTEAAGDLNRILPRLEDLHAELGGVLSLAAAALPRMAHFQPRFDHALATFRGGDTEALARPMSGSYHDIWMELHEDLLLSLGLERTDADG